MNQRALWAMGLCVGSLVVTGCQPADIAGAEEGDVAEARQAQMPVNPDKWWTHYEFEINENPLFDVLVIGAEDVGSFDADTEYWYVHASGLADLGEKDISVTSTSGDELDSPPSLSGDQEFTQPVYLTWQSFSTDPVNVGELYSKGNHHLRVKEVSGDVTRVVWYQVINHQSPQNVGPDGTYEAVGGSVSVPSGYYGYHVDATIE